MTEFDPKQVDKSDPLAMSAHARGQLIEIMENGDKCNPQTPDGKLLETTDEKIEAFIRYVVNSDE